MEYQGQLGRMYSLGFAGVAGFLHMASGGDGWLNKDVMLVGLWLLVCPAHGGCSLVYHRGWLADWSHWCGSSSCSGLLK